MEEHVYIINAKRTAVGKFGGSLITVPATELAGNVIRSLLKITPHVINHVDEVILGNVLSAGLGQNPARIAAFKGGVHQKVPSFTVNKVCGSSLRSIILGAQSILLNDARVIVAGGMENMSRCPYLLDNYRFGVKTGHHVLRDAMIYDGLFCSLIQEPMGITAENIALKYHITKEEQDAYALESHRKALLAIKNGSFSKQIIPITVSEEKTNLSFYKDEQPRKDTNLRLLAKLRPGFNKNGSVTAGNACTLNDGAAAVLLGSASFVKKNKIRSMARIVQYAYVGLDPKFMGLGAYYAAKQCLIRANLETSAIDLWEINEAFASQSIAVQRLLGIDSRIVNVNGGAIALGHPIGASGARILTTLIYELKKRSKRYGMVSLCIGGGQGIAMLVENT